MRLLRAMKLRGKVPVLAGLAVVGAVLAAELWLLHTGLPEQKAVRPQSLPAVPAAPGLAAIALAGSDEAFSNNLGVTFASKGHYEEAIVAFQRAVSANPNYLPGHKNLLAACVETKRWPEALKAALKAEELHPLSPDLKLPAPPRDEAKLKALKEEKDFLSNLARAYLENSNLNEAELRYKLYLALFPHDLRAMNGLGEVAFRSGEHERALEVFARSLMLYGDQPEVAGRLEEMAKDGPLFAAKARAVLETYLEPKERRPGYQLPGRGAAVPRVELTVPGPAPVVELPRAPVPLVDEPGERTPRPRADY